ncbi:hypothetical protein, partial [Moorena sp. SIO3I6]|uniref:hypothetical protein n=1 Tax=Moorena sp. SIO3I6 TaxID=2607831 RepID=UPI0013F8F09A
IKDAAEYKKETTDISKQDTLEEEDVDSNELKEDYEEGVEMPENVLDPEPVLDLGAQEEE